RRRLGIDFAWIHLEKSGGNQIARQREDVLLEDVWRNVVVRHDGLEPRPQPTVVRDGRPERGADLVELETLAGPHVEKSHTSLEVVHDDVPRWFQTIVQVHRAGLGKILTAIQTRRKAFGFSRLSGRKAAGRTPEGGRKMILLGWGTVVMVRQPCAFSSRGIWGSGAPSSY